jgi:hypothetical protein
MMATKAVGRTNLTEGDVKATLLTIDVINALPEDATQFKNRLLSDWKVPSKLEGLFYPDCVKCESNNRLFDDVLVREKINEDEAVLALDYSKFVENLDMMAGIYKATADLNSDIQEFRKKRSIFDAYPRMVNENGFVHWMGDEYWVPFQLNVDLGFKKSYFNASIDDVTEELILNIRKFFG